MSSVLLARVVDQQRSLTLALQQQARDYQSQARSANTVRAYRADWQHFTNWCERTGFCPLPASPETVALYLSDLAQAGLKTSTIRRRLASISTAHQAAAIETPTRSAQVRFTLAGIARVHGDEQVGKAPALVNDLQAMLKAIAPRRRKSVGTSASGTAERRYLRDRAILLVGFGGAFRRSELVGLDIADLDWQRAGVAITIRRSKTDQEGHGRRLGIPRGAHPETCPVRALDAWLGVLGPEPEGAIFRSIDRHGHMRGRLSGRAVAEIVKRAAAAAGLDSTRFAGHSLRAGFATSAIKAGVSELRAMKQTGHKSQQVFRRYVREAELFEGDLSRTLGL